MRAFIDSSSLFKRYVVEKGAEEFNRLLETVFEIIVSPITVLEVHSIIERRLREKSLKIEDGKWIEKEFLKDYGYFGVVSWEDELIETATRLIRKHQLRVLDGIQLASGLICNPDLFITSDKQLFKAASQECKKTVFI